MVYGTEHQRYNLYQRQGIGQRMSLKTPCTMQTPIQPQEEYPNCKVAGERRKMRETAGHPSQDGHGCDRPMVEGITASARKKVSKMFQDEGCCGLKEAVVIGRGSRGAPAVRRFRVRGRVRGRGLETASSPFVGTKTNATFSMN